jgi:hypothetical protein
MEIFFTADFKLIPTETDFSNYGSTAQKFHSRDNSVVTYTGKQLLRWAT